MASNSLGGVALVFSFLVELFLKMKEMALDTDLLKDLFLFGVVGVRLRTALFGRGLSWSWLLLGELL